MKIVHVIEATATGTLSMASLLANSQVARGYQVEIIYSRRPETPLKLREKFDDRIILHECSMYSLTDKIISLFKLRKLLKKIAPNALFLHSSFAGFLGRVSSWYTLSDTKFLYIPHCISLMRKDISVYKKLVFAAFEWIGALKKCEYIACSHSEKKVIDKLIPFRKCHVIENAVNNKTRNSALHINRKSRVITVGQIRKQKNPAQYGEIAAKVKLINPNVEFIWVGDGDTEYREKLEKAGVSVTGWVDKDIVFDMLMESGVYLSTALWEGMPVSLIEASQAGIPVVASNCAGNIDIITHGKTGWLFSDSDEAASLINKAFDHPHIVNQIVLNSCSEFQDRFSQYRYIDEMDKVMTN